VTTQPADPIDTTDEVDAWAIRRRVADLSWPALVEMMLVSFVGVADMIMVGRLGPAAIAAVGLSNQPMFFTLAVFQALNVGTTALVARFIGAGDNSEANRAAEQSFLVTLLIAVVLSVISYSATPWIIGAMGAEPDAKPLGIAYLQVVSLGIVFTAVSMCLTSALRGAGNTKTPMKINIMTNIINCVGNYVLIYGKLGLPAYGVAGAAMATTLSRVVACIAFLSVVLSKNSEIRLSAVRSYRVRLDLLQKTLQIGFPSAIEQFILRGGQLTYVRIVAGLGTVVLASHQIGMNILSLSFMPGMAFSIAATTLVGQELGAGRPLVAEKSAAETRRMGMIVSGTMAAVLFFGGARIASLYTSDPVVIKQAAMVLRVIGLVQPAQSTQFILAGGLRGAGDTKWPLYSTFIGVWGVRVLMGYIFVTVFHLGLLGAWMGMALDQLIRSSVIYTRFRKGDWKAVTV
jgi:putative MATE family efflux protein